MSDRLALGAMRAAEQLGLNVPRDLSIVGFDDIPQAREVGTGLTTIRQPSREKGRLAAHVLLDGKMAGSETILLPTNSSVVVPPARFEDTNHSPEAIASASN